jgi:hypothetical protein
MTLSSSASATQRHDRRSRLDKRRAAIRFHDFGGNGFAVPQMQRAHFDAGTELARRVAGYDFAQQRPQPVQVAIHQAQRRQPVAVWFHVVGRRFMAHRREQLARGRRIEAFEVRSPERIRIDDVTAQRPADRLPAVEDRDAARQPVVQQPVLSGPDKRSRASWSRSQD